MKLSLMLPTACFALALPFAANADMHGKKDKEEMTNEVIQTLQLQGDKADRVKEIMNTYHQEKEQVKDRMKDEMKQLKETKESNLSAVLTDNEMAQLKELKEAKKGAYKKHCKHHEE